MAGVSLARRRYSHVLGHAYILIRRRMLWPVVVLDAVGYAARRLWDLLRGPDRALPQAEVRSILAIRLDHIGDVLLTTPALSMLKERYPEARLTCLVGSWSADVLQGNPAVDEVLVFDAPWFGGQTRGLRLLPVLVRLWRQLAERRFDLVFDFRGDLRHLILGRLVGQRLYGYGIRGGGFLLTSQIEPDEEAHEVVRYVNLARLVGAPDHESGAEAGDVGPLRLQLSDADRAEATRLVSQLNLDPDRIVVALCPLSRSATRWWMPGRFAALCRHLNDTYGAQILVFGDSSSADFVTEMLAEPLEGVHNLVGLTTLRGFAAALVSVDLVISIESSPIHFASALGKPIVTLFGGTTLPQHWAPHAVVHRIVNRPVACSPCFRISCPLDSVKCMEAIEVDDVIDALRGILAQLAGQVPEIARRLPQPISSVANK